MNSYRHSPENKIVYDELSLICKERLELYRLLQDAKLENLEIGSQKWSDYLKLKIKEYDLKTYSDLLNDEKTSTFVKSQKNDNIAHWMLGLGYCDNDELQNVYLTWELQWFHLIFMNSTDNARIQFFQSNNLVYQEVTVNEMMSNLEDLNSCLGCDIVKDRPRLYKTSWLEILELIEKREAWLHKGVAYFLAENIVYCVKRKLKSEFLECLRFQKKVLPTITDIRYLDFIKNLPIVVPTKIINAVDGVNLQNIDELAETHYPLCMRHLHRVLRLQHHLKYDSKMQYGVFLYYLGLPYEHAMHFWREEFTKKIDKDLYNSKYEYLFKHQYGKVGRKHEYPPTTCRFILNYTPMYQQDHGCPFKHWSSERLRESLEQDCRTQDIADIEDLVKDGKYQKACTRYFCTTKNVPDGDIEVIDSPNAYVQRSITESADVLDNLFSMHRV